MVVTGRLLVRRDRIFAVAPWIIAGGVIGFVLALIIGFYTLADLPRLRRRY